MSQFVPSVGALREVVDALHAFILLDHSSWNYCQREERRYLRPFLRLADALGSVRRFRGKLVGWNPRADRALAAFDEAFRTVAREWEWERLIEPGTGRKAFLKERRERFRETYDRPRFEAAIAWQEGSVRLTDCPPDVDALAVTGRARGYVGTMSVEEAKARFRAVEAERFSSPRLGCCHPRFSPETTNAFSTVFHALSPLVQEAERKTRAVAATPKNDAPSVEPQDAPAPALERAIAAAVSTTESKPPREHPALPQNLDSRAIGLAHEAINRGERINVSEIARKLGCERTKLYDFPAFKALVDHDRKGAAAAKQRRPRGTKDRETRSVEAWDGDD